MKEKSAYFVAGTDTGIGKTHVACALLAAFRAAGFTAVGMKPVAAGVDATGENEDVALLRAASSFAAPNALANPYCFADPIAPHIAAAAAGIVVDRGRLVAALTELRAQADVVIVEGVGGLLVPLGDHLDAADLAVAMNLPTILVVGMRLGCLNHALLTVEALRARGMPLAGWIANRVDPEMACFDENLAALRQRIAAPLLGVLPWAPSATPAASAPLLTLPPMLPS